MKFVFEFGVEKIYLIIIGILMVLQVYQFYIYQKAKASVDRLWSTLTTMSLTMAVKMMEIEKKLEDGEKK